MSSVPPEKQKGPAPKSKGRKKHSHKATEKMLQETEAKGGVVEEHGNGKFKLRCPCGDHLGWAYDGPGDQNYERNIRRWMTQCPRWRGDT